MKTQTMTRRRSFFKLAPRRTWYDALVHIRDFGYEHWKTQNITKRAGARPRMFKRIVSCGYLAPPDYSVTPQGLKYIYVCEDHHRSWWTRIDSAKRRQGMISVRLFHKRKEEKCVIYDHDVDRSTHLRAQRAIMKLLHLMNAHEIKFEDGDTIHIESLPL